MLPSLSTCNIFFGDWPEALGWAIFLEGASHSNRKVGAETLRRKLERFVAGASCDVEWWPASGLAMLGEAAPIFSKPLKFHGDGARTPNYTDKTLYGLFLGGERARVVEELRRLKSQLPDHELLIELGSRFEEGRGHGGFIDGVSNLQELSSEEFDASVFVGPESPQLQGGSFLVFRKYEEDVDMWADLPDRVQEQIVGRSKQSGELLGAGRFWKSGQTTVVLPRAHAAAVRPDREQSRFEWSGRIYRRSVNYTEPTQGGFAQGLLFLSLNRDPLAQTIALHNTHLLPLDKDGDLLLSSGYVRPLYSSVLYLPPGRSFAALG